MLLREVTEGQEVLAYAEAERSGLLARVSTLEGDLAAVGCWQGQAGDGQRHPSGCLIQ